MRPDTSDVFRLQDNGSSFWRLISVCFCSYTKNIQKYDLDFYTAVDGHFPSPLKMLSTCNLIHHYQLIRLTAKALQTMFLHALDAASKYLQLDRSEGVWPTGES